MLEKEKRDGELGKCDEEDDEDEDDDEAVDEAVGS